MLSETAELAREGGWDAVQMREVAQRSDVALGTLYRYFPSKEFLLVSVMVADIESLADRLAVRPAQGDDPVERVVDVLKRANRALQREPDLTIAMIRALVSGNEDILPAVLRTRSMMRRIISDALGVSGEDADRRDGEAASDGVGSAGGVAGVGEGSSESADGIEDDELTKSIDLLSDVWMAALVSWISGVHAPDGIVAKLETASRRLLA